MNRINFEPEEMSQVINLFLEHIKTDFDGEDRNEKYILWRGEAILFFAEKETRGRKFLSNPAFINQLLWGNKETRVMCKKILQNIIIEEFTLRIKEIEKIRREKQ